MCVPAAVAARASQFLVDDVAQFESTRSDEVFVGYPRADASIAEALSGSAPAPRASGPMVVNHLGVGLADVVFANAILRRALQMRDRHEAAAMSSDREETPRLSVARTGGRSAWFWSRSRWWSSWRPVVYSAFLSATAELLQPRLDRGRSRDG